jgi:hypothetical protein
MGGASIKPLFVEEQTFLKPDIIGPISTETFLAKK